MFASGGRRFALGRDDRVTDGGRVCTAACGSCFLQRFGPMVFTFLN